MRRAHTSEKRIRVSGRGRGGGAGARPPLCFVHSAPRAHTHTHTHTEALGDALHSHPPPSPPLTMGQQASQPARPIAAIDMVADVPRVVFKEALGEWRVMRALTC